MHTASMPSSDTPDLMLSDEEQDSFPIDQSDVELIPGDWTNFLLWSQTAKHTADIEDRWPDGVNRVRLLGQDVRGALCGALYLSRDASCK